MSEVIVITSGKGGVGKTTTSANIGTGLAMLGMRVALIDTDIGLRNGARQNLAGPGGGGDVRLEQQVPVLVGHQKAWGNGVAADAGSGKVGGQPLGKVAHCRFGTRVSGDFRQGNKGVHRGNIENAAGFFLRHV